MEMGAMRFDKGVLHFAFLAKCIVAFLVCHVPLWRGSAPVLAALFLDDKVSTILGAVQTLDNSA